jgi:hypothetical protein
MKRCFFFAFLLSLGACGFATKVDPRIAHIRQEHQQLLAKQQAAFTVGAQVGIAREGLRQLVRQSEAIQQALDQLDPARSQEPAQVALITELAREQAKLMEGAAVVTLVAGSSQSSFNEETSEGSTEEVNEAAAAAAESAWTKPTKPARHIEKVRTDMDK